MKTLYKILIATFCFSSSYAQNVGINLPVMTAPTNTLDVNGTIRIRGGAPGTNKVLTSDGNGVGAWANPPSTFVLPYTGSLASPFSAIFSLTNTETTQGDGLITTINSINSGSAISGVAANSSQAGTLVAGVRAANFSTNGNGVGLWAFHAGLGSAIYSNTANGIGATVSSNNGIAGVFNSTTGFSLQTAGKLRFAGNGVGTLGAGKFLKSIDVNGNAEWSDLLPYSFTGINAANLLSITNTNTGNSSAIYGATNSTSYGEGVQGIALATSPSTDTYGVNGSNRSSNSLGAGVSGNHSGSGRGVEGISNSGIGVYGDGGTGVKGEGSYGVHGIGSTYGVFGEKSGTTGSAIHGVGGLRGVYGQSNVYGVYGVSNFLEPDQYKYAGVYGVSHSNNNSGSGVYGTHTGTGPGVSGYSYTGIGGRFNSDGGGYALITQEGNVGIGTSTPVAKIDIAGTTNTSHFYYDTAEDTYIRGGKVTSKVIINDVSTGSVGIGIINPNQYLDVNGRMRLYHKGTQTGPGAITSGIWLNNELNGLGLNDGAFMGINCSSAGNETVGFFIGGTWRFDVNRSGNARFGGSVNATSGFTCASDLRYKKNILPIKNSLENLLKISGVTYDWKQEEFPEKHFSDKNQIGFIAQDLEKIYPEMVFTDAQGYKSVDYARLTPVLVEAIKEQQKQIEELKNEIEKISTLSKKIDKLEELLNKGDLQTSNNLK